MTLPDWAIKENYNIINKRTSNISFHSNSMMECLLQTDKTFDMIYISNITDTFNQKESSALFQQCASHLKRDGKLVIWNNLVERKPSEKFLLMEELKKAFGLLATLHILNWKNALAVKAIIGIGLIVKAPTLTPVETNTRVSTRMASNTAKALTLSPMETNTWVSTRMV